MSASDYLLLKRKLQHDNVLKHHKGLDDRMRTVEAHKLASHRNNLETQKRTLQLELNNIAPPVRTFYMERMEELSRQIATNKEKFPNFRGVYDT